jgi:hypothetical protein
MAAGAIAVALLAAFILVRIPAAKAELENGVFENNCCGTLELRNGTMILNGKPTIRYTVGQDARGPYVIPRAYVGSFEQIGFEVDGARPATRLRLDRLPRPSRILLYGGSKPYLFERNDYVRPAASASR